MTHTITPNISFDCTPDEAQLDELLFSNGRTLQGARDIEIYDELSSLFRDSDGVRRAQAGELVGLLTEAMLRLNALADEIDAVGTAPI